MTTIHRNAFLCLIFLHNVFREGNCGSGKVMRNMPMHIGIGVHGSNSDQGPLFRALVPKGSTLPTENSIILTTSRDGQTSIDYSIYMGDSDSKYAHHYQKVDECRLFLEIAPKGVPRIRLEIAIDEQGVFKVFTNATSGTCNKLYHLRELLSQATFSNLWRSLGRQEECFYGLSSIAGAVIVAVSTAAVYLYLSSNKYKKILKEVRNDLKETRREVRSFYSEMNPLDKEKNIDFHVMMARLKRLRKTASGRFDPGIQETKTDDTEQRMSQQKTAEKKFKVVHKTHGSLKAVKGVVNVKHRRSLFEAQNAKTDTS